MTSLEAHRAKSTSQLLFTVHECPSCNTRVDVSRYNPGQKLACPGCGTGFFVQGTEEPAATPKPRVVRGPVVVNQPKPWAKIAIAAGGILALGAGLFIYQRARVHNEITILPPEPPSTVPVKAATREAVGSAIVPVVASRSGVAPGIYVVKNVQSGLALDLYKYGTGLDARLHLEPASGGGNQRWIFRPMGPETWEIVSFHSFKALEVDKGSSDDSARIAQAKLNGSSAQLWRLERVGDAFKIVAQGTGKALAQTDDLPKGAHIGQRASGSGTEQLWKLEGRAALPREADQLFSGASTKPPMPVSAVAGAAPIDGRFVPIPFGDVANADSREGLFLDPKTVQDSVHPMLTGWIRAGETPFQLLPTSGKNLVLLQGGQGAVTKRYPAKVEIPMGNARLTKLHFLGGVAAWGYPWGGPADDRSGSVMVKVIVVRQGGVEESFVLRNGFEFADYSTAADVPGSAKVNGLVGNGRQVRTFSKTLANGEPVEKIILTGYAGHATPVFLAMTGETR
jgi:hypothetical protein